MEITRPPRPFALIGEGPDDAERREHVERRQPPETRELTERHEPPETRELTARRDPPARPEPPETPERPEMREQPGALSVIGWPDPVIDKLGHDPRSAYVERFWLAILGPSTTWLLRRLAAGLDASPDGFDLNLAATARSLGLGGKVSRHGPFQKSIGRLVIFELGRAIPPSGLAVRRFVPPLPRRHLIRLDTSAQEEHRLWLQAQEHPDPEVSRIRSHARRVALGLFSLGDAYETVETELLGWHLHPALASDATSWAWRHSGRGGLPNPGFSPLRAPGG
jgi:hypothetical protein